MQGNATVELRSRTADLAQLLVHHPLRPWWPASAAANLMRTETAYDLRGNVIERRMPTFDVSTGLPPVGANLQLSTINGSCLRQLDRHAQQYGHGDIRVPSGRVHRRMDPASISSR